MLLLVAPLGAALADSPLPLTAPHAAQEDLPYTELYELVAPSVVYIEVVGRSDNNPFSTGGLGSGFVYDTEGHIVTNFHVVEGAQRIDVTFFDGTFARAEIIGIDPESDLAVIRVQDVDPAVLRPIALGDSFALRVGEGVVAIGNPFGQTWTMTTGIVSAKGRSTRVESGFSLPEMIQTDAAINPGNSGGPLVNLRGEVVGVNTIIFTETQVNSGVGLAVPAAAVQRVVPELITNGEIKYTWLGISGGDLNLDLIELMDLDPDTRGVLISRVSPDSPADNANLRGSTQQGRVNGLVYEYGGDIITAINGEAVTTIDELVAYLVYNTRPGDRVTLSVLRNGKMLEIPAVLEARPASAR
jgi:S1-C subfamily serine protease